MNADIDEIISVDQLIDSALEEPDILVEFYVFGGSDKKLYTLYERNPGSGYGIDLFLLLEGKGKVVDLLPTYQKATELPKVGDVIVEGLTHDRILVIEIGEV